MDKRCGTALRDLRDAWRGHELPDGKAIGGKKNRLTELNIKKLQVNYAKAIRSNVAPVVKTAKDHKDAVDKMRKAVMASLCHIRELKQTDAAAVMRRPTSKSPFKRVQGQVNSVGP